MSNPRLRHIELNVSAKQNRATDTLPDVNAMFERSATQPLEVAIAVRKGIAELEQGYHEQLRNYVAVGYSCAYYVKKDESLIVEFDKILLHLGIIAKSNVQNTQDRLLYRMFELLVVHAGRGTYTNGLNS